MRKRGGQVLVTATMFGPASKATRVGIEAEAGRLGEFLGGTAEVLIEETRRNRKQNQPS